jgi:23S rRNA A2030 N6-methylase RlmJ
MNFTQKLHWVFNHTLLCLLIKKLQKKATPIRPSYPAGVGMLDLRSNGAQRTREADDGLREGLRIARRYYSTLPRYGRAFDAGDSYYPGSPPLMRSMLRKATAS